MRTLNPLRHYGKLSDSVQKEYLYQLTGQQLGLEYRCELVITDFQGHGWHSAFTLDEIVESLTDTLPEPEQLRSWIGKLENPVIQTNDMSGSVMEATVQLTHSNTIRIRLPPAGALKLVDTHKDTQLHNIYRVVGFGLFEAYESHTQHEGHATRKRCRSQAADPPSSVNKETGVQHPINSPKPDQPSSRTRASPDFYAYDEAGPSTSQADGSLPGSPTGAQSSIGQPRVVHGRAGRGALGGRRPARGGLKIVRP